MTQVALPLHRTDGTEFDLSAAQDALARSDYGVDALPGDAFLIEALEGYCDQEYSRFEDAQCALEYADHLATQCPACGVDGATGPVCDECAIDAEADDIAVPSQALPTERS